MPSICHTCGAALPVPLFPCLHCALQNRPRGEHPGAQQTPPPPRPELRPDATARQHTYEPTVRPVRPHSPTVAGTQAPPPPAGAQPAPPSRAALWVAVFIVLSLLAGVVLVNSLQHQHGMLSKAPSSPTPAAAVGQDVRGAGVPREPTMSHAPPPHYPQAMVDRGAEGTVRMGIEVDADGTVRSVDIVESSGFVELDQAAVRAAVRWRFIPATRDGAAVRARIEVPITFAAE